MADFAKLLLKTSMSDYCKSLDPTSQHIYVEKLSYLSMKKAEDPFCNREKFMDDMSIMASSGIWAYILLLRGTPWTLYKKKVTSMEKPRWIQLLQKWSCEGGKSMGNWVQLQHSNGSS